MLKRTYKILNLCIFNTVILLYITGCGSFNAYPTTEDIKLGKQVVQEIKSNPKEYPILQNRDVTNYIQEILNKILQSPLIKYKGTFAYTAEVINNDSIVNAFCTPGGYIYVYTGLLKYIDNEATLAGVLAHEIAHAELRHATQRMTKATETKLLGELVMGNNPNKNTQLAGNLFSGLSLMNNSRDNEYEADAYSFKYLQTTEWYPGSIIFFFDKIKANSDNNEFKLLLSTHPLAQDRYDQIISLLKKADIPPPSEKNIFFRKYLKFKKTL
ncbi:MAG: M48 family metalloprotease [FCB group bacterium]|jgi:predicted Zn-dependent protease